MDRKKPSPPASEDLLSAIFVPTPFGYVCSSMEFRCLRCDRSEVIKVTDEQIGRIDREEFAGSAVATYLAQESGWVVSSAKRLSMGRIVAYTICPACVEQDLAAYSLRRK